MKKFKLWISQMHENYWIRRIFTGLLVIVLVLSLNFFLFRLMPGDPTSTLLDPRFSPEAKQELLRSYGLDKPMVQQFFIYVKQMLTFRFGISFLSQKPVWQELAERLPNTLALLLPSLCLSAILGSFLGVMAAKGRGKFTERIVLMSGAISFSFPSFFVQLVLLLLLAHTFPLFPLRGSTSIPPPVGFLSSLADRMWHMALPVASLVLLGFGSWALYVRNLMVKTLGEDFILLAQAKGLKKRQILWRHAFRTALPPIITIFFLSLPGVISGAVITETVFSLHGVGKFLLEAVSGHDYPAAGAAFYLLALITVICNLLADVVYTLVDPRISFRKVRR